MIIAWIIAAVGINGLMICVISQEVSFRWIFSDVFASALFLLAVIFAILLGYFAGALFVWPFLRPICPRINGGPFAPGDRVRVLAGPYRRLVVTVSRTTIGQGGWQLAELTLSTEAPQPTANIVEEYTLLKNQ